VFDGIYFKLSELIKKWIRPGTTVVTDCWAAYRSLPEEGFNHIRVNHSITFVNEDTGAHTNTIESTWKHVKATLNPYNRRVPYDFFLADYTFRQKCKAEGIRQFCKFMEIVESRDWSNTKGI
jgi:hypothetical protein